MHQAGGRRPFEEQLPDSVIAHFFSKPHTRNWLLPWTQGGDGKEDVLPTTNAVELAVGYGLDLVMYVDESAASRAMLAPPASRGIPFGIRRLLVPLTTVDNQFVLGHVLEDPEAVRKRCAAPSEGELLSPLSAPEVLSHRFWMDLRDFGAVQSCLVLADGAIFLSRNVFSQHGGVIFGETLACAPCGLGQMPKKVVAFFRAAQDCIFCRTRGQRCECDSLVKLRTFGPLTGGRSVVDLIQAGIQVGQNCPDFGSMVEQYISRSHLKNTLLKKHRFEQIASDAGPSRPTQKDSSQSLQEDWGRDEASVMEDEKGLADIDQDRRKREFRREHKCSECEKSFKQRVHLNAHYRTVHQGIKAYSCEACSATLSSAFNLHRHYRVLHALERDKICGTCGKGFFTINLLEQHVQESHK